MPFEPIKGLFSTIRFRLTLWNAVVVLLVVVSSLIALRIGVQTALRRETDARLAEDTLEVALLLRERYPNEQLIQQELDRKAQGHTQHRMFVQLLDAEMRPQWKSLYSPEVDLVLSPQSEDLSLLSAGEYRLAIRKLQEPQFAGISVLVGASELRDRESVNNLTKLILLIGGVVLVLSPVGGYWLAGRATAPFAQINQTAASLRPIKFNERLPLRGTGDELDQLSETINTLLDRLAEYLRKNQRFIANAAHELRSPLSAIQSSVEVALNGDRTVADYQDLLAEIVEECSALRKIVNELLLLAEADAGGVVGRFSPVRVDEIVKRSVAMFKDAADEQGVHLQVGRCEPATVLGNAGHLRQVFNNLIDNGIKFNRSGGNVIVSVTADEAQQVRIDVQDDGGGIDPADQDRVFERFFRCDRSRSRDLKKTGSGLGLSICASLVEGHNGSISVASTPGEGTTFTILIPQAPAAENIPA